MNIAILGIGLMGQALGEHLLQQHCQLTVYNRHPEKTQDLVSRGAHAAQSAQDAVQNKDSCLLFLSDAEAIHAVLATLTPADIAGKTWIQMGTIAPDESREIAQYIHHAQGHYLECPVLGSLPEARTGQLILMAAGEQRIFDLSLPLLKLIGPKPEWLGDIGQASTVKLAMNQLIAGLTSSFSLSLALIEKEHVNVDQFMSIVRDSALYAPTFDKKLSRMVSGDFTQPNFPTKHLAKDTRLFLAVAQQLGINTCALEGIAQLLDNTLDKGLADTDYSALYAGVNPDKLPKTTD